MELDFEILVGKKGLEQIPDACLRLVISLDNGVTVAAPPPVSPGVRECPESSLDTTDQEMQVYVVFECTPFKHKDILEVRRPHVLFNCLEPVICSRSCFLL
jgi:hypothetical protein